MVPEVCMKTWKIEQRQRQNQLCLLIGKDSEVNHIGRSVALVAFIEPQGYGLHPLLPPLETNNSIDSINSSSSSKQQQFV